MELVVLFLTDVEGSSRLWQAHPLAMPEVIDRLDATVLEAVSAHHGVLEKPLGEGDSHFVWFKLASDAVRAAVALQRKLSLMRWPEDIDLQLRVALHAGEVQRRLVDFAGVTVNRAARIRSAAHGGQIVASRVVAELAPDDLGDGIAVTSLGWHRIRDIPGWTELFQVWAPPLCRDFPGLVTLDAGLPPLVAIVVLDVHRVMSAATSLDTPDQRALWGVFVELFTSCFTRAGGQYYQHLGDGCIALFADPTVAVAFARDARSNVRALDLELKAVVHVGRVEMMHGIAYGADLPIASMAIRGAPPGKVAITAAAAPLIDHADDIVVVEPATI